ncbi:hypothetical protein M378DRAFT_163108, partial [Amanita muscaria Koide BX008]
MYLTGMKPNMPPVPVIPSSITRQCVYGHILTDAHRDNFRRLHPDIAEWQSSSPRALVSIASMLIPGCLTGATTKVYDRGQWHVCLTHVDNRLFYPQRIADRRRSNRFIAALEKSLGITGEPQWYPCYA